jgi:hypothetical protein
LGDVYYEKTSVKGTGAVGPLLFRVRTVYHATAMVTNVVSRYYFLEAGNGIVILSEEDAASWKAVLLGKL